MSKKNKKQTTTTTTESADLTATVAEQATEPTTEAPKAPKLTKDGLVALPSLPKAARKPKPAKECSCGCGLMTKGGKFLPGHDARLHGWVLRIERGVCQLTDIPEGERVKVVEYMAAAK